MKRFGRIDFTLGKYEELCEAIQCAEYDILTVNNFLVNREDALQKKIIILRHDVDRKPLNAWRMAKVERKLGISSTYYFRARALRSQTTILEEIAGLGHEIGYHYENLSEMHGDFDQAMRDFAANLARFRKIVPIRTICMHGSPLSRWNNSDIWRMENFKDFDLTGEPYISINYNEIIYLTDTGRTWSTDCLSVRDKVESSPRLPIRSTSALIKILNACWYDRFLIQCHPERWSSSISGWIWSACSDYLSNGAKVPIYYLLNRERGQVESPSNKKLKKPIGSDPKK